MTKLIKDSNKIYKTRNIIRAFENKKLIEPDFEWINNADAFNKILGRANENIGIEAKSDDKVFSLKKVMKSLDDIMPGRINKYNVEKEYVEKIMNDQKLLRSCKGFSKSKNAQTIASIMNDVKNAVFGSLSLLELEDDTVNIDIRDMSPLETEEEAAERQKGQGLKILTPQQMITRLPILLTQLKAGNNSQKLKYDIRQLLYSLYRSKKLSKTIYNCLMNTI